MPVVSPVICYRLGDGHLAFRSDDDSLRQRMRELHRDCEIDPAAATAPIVHCDVRVNHAWALASFEDPEPLDPVAFARPPLQIGAIGKEPVREPPGWRRLEAETTLMLSDRHVLAERDTPWQRFVGNLAVNRVLRLQHEAVFFHASAAALDTRGLLLVGPKGAGKTTLSLALGARGWDFLGDEMIGVRYGSGELVPVRRSVTIKPGPADARIRAAAEHAPHTSEAFPDGGVRLRVPASRLFPEARRHSP